MRPAKEAKIHVDYDYRSDHGAYIRIKAFALKDGERISGWGYLPDMVHGHGEGTATAKLSYHGWGEEDIPKRTEQLELLMSSYRTGVFYRKAIDLPITWGGEKKNYYYNHQ